MRTILILSGLLFSAIIAEAQDTCSIHSLRNVFESIKKIDLTEKRPLTLKRYASFNFSAFQPIEKETSQLDYFEIGYCPNGEIGEITYVGKSKFITNYKLIVYNLTNYRLLVLQHFNAGKYLFTPIVIVMFKGSKENYGITVAQRFGTENACCGFPYYSEFPVSKIEDISSIIALNDDLYPTQFVQLSTLQIVISSDIYYEKDNPVKVKKEVASFFLSPTYYSNLKIDPKMCLSHIVKACQVPPDLIVEMNPNMHGFDEIPLWLFGGSHDYKKCNP